ncbi:ABC transporter ATP-binding protein [Rhodococcus sp. IEGM 1241]|uniref:ABC transporter ATP-binding protein n=1 Tax=Rhodococcus sp. IEGM 1241 TaxID=3082228 RepID=UPI002952D38F|nr:ABC transporter ATP-binding protein [Rhodococcus sp. IEGM 1241]MDV8010125.1 ABC transporter ATP-binding protein [Rhodococcus sp. IEGM 1241]
MSSFLEVRGLSARYGQLPVLHGVDLSVEQGEIVILLGANGAGKTTTLRALCSLVSTSGSAIFDGTELVGKSTRSIVRRGVAMVPQGRGTFKDLTVLDNLYAGAYLRKGRAEISADIAMWFERFPRLAERREQKSGTLSGGEQQMLAVARAMMSRPRLLLLDEPSLGLAPLVVQELFNLLSTINKDLNTSMLVVEQSAELALAIADRGYVLEAGHTVLSGSATELQSHDGVRQAYLGL